MEGTFMINNEKQEKKCDNKCNEELLKVIQDFKDEEYISIMKIQIKYSIGFNKAGKIFNDLLNLGLLLDVKNKKSKNRFKLNKEKINTFLKS